MESNSDENKVKNSLNIDDYNPSLRFLQIPKSPNESCGFHLSRSKWDPYPWISAVDQSSLAESSGLKAGECVLEVNGEDVLGLRISNIAQLVKENSDCVTLLLWSTGSDATFDSESLCSGPMPLNLERLCANMQTILTIIECPVCLDTIAPPVMQCQNGHLTCVKCRIKAEKCPVCRDRNTPRRSLIAEQIYNSIRDAFSLQNGNESKLRQKLFGTNYQNKTSPLPEISPSLAKRKSELANSDKRREINKSSGQTSSCLLPTNKFLAKLLRGKASSMDNLSNSTPSSGNSLSSKKVITQSFDTTKANNENTEDLRSSLSLSSTSTSKGRTSSLVFLKPLNTLSKNVSLSTNDLLKKDMANLIAVERCPSVNPLFRSTTGSVRNYTVKKQCVTLLDKRPCSSVSASMECIRINSRTTVDMTKSRDELSTSSPPSMARMPATTTSNIKADDVPDFTGGLRDVAALKVTETMTVSRMQENNLFRCPCDCGINFSASTLQRHVKEDHRIPILCYGNSSADISVPLRAPIIDAAILLLLDGSKRFWIKLKAIGNKCIYASALLQGTEDESTDFMMETRLRNRLGERTLERELITRSIVPSMMKTTWNETFINISNGSAICDNRENTPPTFCGGNGHAGAYTDDGVLFKADGIDCELQLTVVVNKRNW